jgi:predicted nucleotidyltransferase
LYVATLNGRLPVVAAMVVGSVARGDFNLWSDIDLVVVIDRDLPARAVDRLALADEGRPPGIQAVLWTPGEFADALRRNNPMAVEAITVGVVVRGSQRLSQVGPTYPRDHRTPAKRA